MPGLTQATSQVNALVTALTSLQTVMTKIQSSTSGFTNSVSSMTKSMSGMSSGGGGGGVTTYGQSGSSIGGLASSLISPTTGGFLSDLALFPARFINTQLQNNRNVVNAAGQMLGNQSFSSGTTLQSMLGTLARQPGGVMGGNPADILNVMGIARQAGAGFNWASSTGQSSSPRAAGFLESIRQGQIINPGTDAGAIAMSVGGYMANVGSQQQGAFLTGGAFSMIGSGNRAKSISEWAEGILKWFMNQRPGSKRGKPFDYGELMSQNFPGSNMDAWFSANGVPQDMRDYFWSYALGKASQTGTTGGASILQLGQDVPTTTQQNPIYQRLAAGNVATRQSFNLGGKLTGVYGNIEQSNRWFNDLLSQMVGQTLPGALSQGGLSWMQYLPDEIRNLLMTAAESTKVGALGAGVLGWGSLLSGGSSSGQDPVAPGGGLPMGDVGDVGDYGPMGTSGLAGLHPDMRRKVAAMMRANPNLSITSGHRDLAKQQSLKRKGFGRVSGRASAHTRGMAADIGPASQYGWLVKNAGKFGLSSGIGSGEPWHVGMGDVGDTISDIVGAASGAGGVLGNLLSVFAGAMQTGVSPDTQMQVIGQGTSTLLKALLSLFAATPNTDNLAFRDVYGSLTKYTKDALASGSTGLPSILPSAGGSGGSTGILPDSMSRAIVAAKAAAAAGFHKDELFKMLSIAGRESGWDPNAVNAATSDRGLFQINMKANLGQLSAAHIAYNEQDLFDPYINAKAAWYLFDKGGHSWRPWKGSDTGWKGNGPGWDPNGDEMWHTESKQPIAQAAIVAAGVGDVDGFGGPSTGGSSRVSAIVFHNTFQMASGGGSGTNGVIDSKRAAAQIADQLEQQMKQRMSRSN
jgi:hypothetical protein